MSIIDFKSKREFKSILTLNNIEETHLMNEKEVRVLNLLKSSIVFDEPTKINEPRLKRNSLMARPSIGLNVSSDQNGQTRERRTSLFGPNQKMKGVDLSQRRESTRRKSLFNDIAQKIRNNFVLPQIEKQFFMTKVKV